MQTIQLKSFDKSERVTFLFLLQTVSSPLCSGALDMIQYNFNGMNDGPRLKCFNQFA